MDEVRHANAALPSQIAHPIDTAKDIASATGKGIVGMLPASAPALLHKASQAWQAGDHVTAIRHALNYITPLVGQASDQAGDEVESGDYGKAVGHTLAAIAPLLFGKLGGAPEAEPTAEPTPTKTPVQSEVAAKPVAKVATAPMSDASRAAAAYMRANRMEAPAVEVIDSRNPVEDTGTVNIGGKTQQVRGGTPKGVADVEGENAAAKKITDQIEQEKIKANDPVEILAGIRKRAGITSKPSPTAVGESSLKDVTPEVVSRARVRATSNYTYKKIEGDLLNQHKITVTDPSGKQIGVVGATEEVDRPNQWTVRVSDAAPKGTEIGLEAYSKLMRQAEQQATKSGKPVTVQGDVSISDSAQRTWQKLGKEYPVTYENGRPSITLQPKSKPTAPTAPAAAQPAAGFVGRALESQGVQPNWTSAITGEQPEGIISRYNKIVDTHQNKPIDIPDSEWQQHQ
jgi:hypothetical protein